MIKLQTVTALCFDIVINTVLMLSFYKITTFYPFVIHLASSLFELRRVINQYTHLTHGLSSHCKQLLHKDSQIANDAQTYCFQLVYKKTADKVHFIVLNQANLF